jgi:hypothetical protein
VINIQSTLRIAPDLCKNVSIAVHDTETLVVKKKKDEKNKNNMGQQKKNAVCQGNLPAGHFGLHVPKVLQPWRLSK